MNIYYHFLAEESDYFCGVQKTPSVLDDIFWRFMEGERAGGDYPGSVVFDMGLRYPGIVVADMIQNNLGYCLLSAKARKLLELHSGVEIEFLAFKLRNKKGRMETGDYYIANVIGTRDCVDMKRTEGQLSLSEPGTFMTLRKLYLEARKIPPDARLFRIQAMPEVLIIREDLKAVFDQQGVTGVGYVRVGDAVRY